MMKMDKDKLLDIRKEIKRRKPTFMRQEVNKKIGIEKKWIKPRGLHSKLRLRRRGHQSFVSPGYKSPSKVRGLHKSGYEPIVVANANLDKINSKTQAIIISGAVGTKKRIDIIKAAKNKGIKILNIKDADLFVKEAEEAVKKRKELREQSTKAKEEEEKKRKKEDKKKDDSKGIEKAVSEEEKAKEDEHKKEEEKKEKDKVLTKRT
jgi:large subunit ribosomal protein L32e